MLSKDTLIFNLTVSQLQQLIDEGINKGLKKIPLQAPEQPDLLNDIITIEEACKLINLARPTIYGLVQKRKIPHFKQGGLRFRRKELIAWIEAGRKKTMADIHAEAEEYTTRHKNKSI